MVENKAKEVWKTSDGHEVTVMDIIDALHNGSALLKRDAATNPKVIPHPALVLSYKLRAEILDMIKERYYKILEMHRPSPKLEIPGGRKKK